MSTFQAFDKNKDGVLSRDEILQGYTSLYGESIAKEECVIFYYFK
jgi:Ca2+-binding EF-hand superfamily protein